MMKPVENPFITNAYGYSTMQPEKISTFNNAHEFATKAAANAVVRELQTQIPDIGVLEIVDQYQGNFCNVQKYGDRKHIESDPALMVLSIRRQGTPFLHNAGEIYNQLSKGYTSILDELRGEMGV